MTGSTPPAPERRELGTLFRDRRAAEALGVLTSPVKAEHLELDCGHVPQLEAPARTHDAIARFLLR